MRSFYIFLLSLTFFCTKSQGQWLIVGTYDSPKSEGIYVYQFNSKDGTAKEISHVKTSNPSFVAISPDNRFVYAVHETAPQDGKGGDIAAFSFNKSNGTLTFINRQLSGGDHPCHVEVDQTGRWLFASNYTSGTLSVLPINADGSLGTARTIQHSGSGKNPVRQKGPHVHGAIISPDNKKLFVTDLGIDKLMIYSFDETTGEMKPADPPYIAFLPGSGPRLFTFSPDKKSAYVVEELSGNVTMMSYKKGKLTPLQRVSTMPKGDTLPPNSADVHLTPDGKYLYASNRGDVNSIAVFGVNGKGKLTNYAYQPVLGKTPRNFSIDPSGNFLLCANQNSDEIVVFRIDKMGGLLVPTGTRIQVGKPVCIKWVSAD